MLKSKWKVLAVLAFFLVVLVGGGLYADFRAGNYAQENQGTIRQTIPTDVSTDANYSAGQYPMFDPELAPGEGKETFEIYCGTCHTPRYITSQAPLPAAMWAAEVEKMRKTFGAAIPDDDAKKIVQYLSEHYTAETRKR